MTQSAQYFYTKEQGSTHHAMKQGLPQASMKKVLPQKATGQGTQYYNAVEQGLLLARGQGLNEGFNI